VQVVWCVTASFAVLALAPSCRAQSAPASRLDVRLVSDEADAVLSILAKKKSSEAISAKDWERLFSSEGYIRLKKREVELKRTFTDDEFRTFVLSDELAGRAQVLQETLARWSQADLGGAASRALAYLPEGARIRAKIYPVIKPKTNSFVFETKTDPAIFLYIDPAITAAKFENNLAHELHHIGYSSSCLPRLTSEEFNRLPEKPRTILEWVGAFGEGIAMLAAAGGPDVHPHEVSSPEDRARWDHDVAYFNDDLRKVERFFLEISEGRLTGEEAIRERGFSFFGIQGPWYTVGWKMGVTIEKVEGRKALIGCLCEPAELLFTYNRAAAALNRSATSPLAVWSPALLEPIRKAVTSTPPQEK
jgi:hypothetical protein